MIIDSNEKFTFSCFNRQMKSKTIDSDTHGDTLFWISNANANTLLYYYVANF